MGRFRERDLKTRVERGFQGRTDMLLLLQLRLARDLHVILAMRDVA
jgi:hypothetical protein